MLFYFVNIDSISRRISGVLTNDIDDRDILGINRILQNIVGESDVEKVLQKYGLVTLGRPSGKARTLGFKKLSEPIRNAFLWVENGKGEIRKKKPKSIDWVKQERSLGPFTEEVDYLFAMNQKGDM